MECSPFRSLSVSKSDPTSRAWFLGNLLLDSILELTEYGLAASGGVWENMEEFISILNELLFTTGGIPAAVYQEPMQFPAKMAELAAWMIRNRQHRQTTDANIAWMVTSFIDNAAELFLRSACNPTAAVVVQQCSSSLPALLASATSRAAAEISAADATAFAAAAAAAAQQETAQSVQYGPLLTLFPAVSMMRLSRSLISICPDNMAASSNISSLVIPASDFAAALLKLYSVVHPRLPASTLKIQLEDAAEDARQLQEMLVLKQYHNGFGMQAQAYSAAPGLLPCSSSASCSSAASGDMVIDISMLSKQAGIRYEEMTHAPMDADDEEHKSIAYHMLAF